MIGCTNHSCTRSARSCIHTKCPVTPRCNPTNCPHFCDAGGGQWRGLFHLVFVGTLIVILFVFLSLLCWVGFTSYLMNKVSSIYVKQVQWKIDFSIGRLHVFLFSHTHRTLYIIRLSSDCDPRQSCGWQLAVRWKVFNRAVNEPSAKFSQLGPSPGWKALVGTFSLMWKLRRRFIPSSSIRCSDRPLERRMENWCKSEAGRENEINISKAAQHPEQESM